MDIKQKIVFVTISLVICLNNILALSYIYSDLEEDSSSIQTVSNPTFNFQSKAQMLVDLDSGYTIYANNENEKIYPASVTKIMSMLLIMEAIDSGRLSYEDTITCSAKASSMGGSQIWFREGETLSVHDCLKAIAVVSANDVCVAMSEHLAGSEENFVNMMNEKAKLLGMNNTNFVNPHGLDDENHYTTAYDISLMARELVINHPDILKYSSIWMDTLRDGTFALTNTNKLIRFYEGATGLKTGSTSIAKFNLAATAKRENTHLLSVVCTAPASDIRTAETKSLLDYGFSNFESNILKEKGTIIGSVIIDKSNVERMNFKLKNSITYLSKKGSKCEYNEVLLLNEGLVAPLEKGTVVGKVEVYDKETDNKISECDLILVDLVEKANFNYYIKKTFDIFQ